VLLGAALLAAGAGVGVGACGGSQPHSATAGDTSQTTTSSEEPLPTATTTSVIPPGQPVRGDGDADNPGDIDGNGDSDSARVGGPDVDSDSPTTQSYRFPDSDDGPIFAYGHRPSAAVAHAIASVVRRYYAAAARGDGASACALLPSTLAHVIPKSYSEPRDPAYLRGTKSCGATLARFFGHYHRELAAPIELFSVRVEGETARVIYSSRTTPASDVFLTRHGSSWQLIEVRGRPLP
jgi:hypothetical protein